MKRILITGSTGFIGKAVLAKLLDCDFEVATLCRFPEINHNKDFRITLIQDSLDLSNHSLEAIKDFNPEIILHLAWQDIPDFSFATSAYNLQLSLCFLEKVLQKCEVKRVIVAGSCWEAGKTNGVVYPHDWLIKNHFTWAKKSIYDWLQFQSKNKNFSLAWARLFFVYGPDQRSESLIPYILKNYSLKSRLPIINHPNNCLDFIFIEDVADAFINLITHSEVSGIFNIGSGKAYQVKKIADFIGKLFLQNSQNQHISSTFETDDNHTQFWADLSDTMLKINWKPKYSIEAGLIRTYNLYHNT